MENLTAPNSGPSVVLLAEFTAKPGYAETVAELLDGLATKVREEEGNIAFDCYRRADDASKFVVYEIYRDKAAFESHIAADYGAVFNARLREVIVEPNSILTFLDPMHRR